MLALTRKPQERAVVRTPAGEVLVVTIARVDRNKVRILFDGPMSFEIDREEVYVEKYGPLPKWQGKRD